MKYATKLDERKDRFVNTQLEYHLINFELEMGKDWPNFPGGRKRGGRHGYAPTLFENKLGMWDGENWDNKDAPDFWSCSDGSLIAFSKYHGAAGYSAALKLLWIAQETTDNPAEAIEVFKAELKRRVEKIGARLVTVVEASRKSAEERAVAAWAKCELQDKEDVPKTSEECEQIQLATGKVPRQCENRFASSTGWRCECHQKLGNKEFKELLEIGVYGFRRCALHDEHYAANQKAWAETLWE